MNQPGATPLYEARAIVKRFGHVTALDGADFSVYPGEVVALVGDNGAGKSTLVKTLSGALQHDEGELLFNGEPVVLHTPLDARALGIETVYQDLALAPDLDPAMNAFLGREVMQPGVLGKLGFLDRKTMRRRTADAFTSLGVGVRSTTVPVGMLSGGQRQGVAVSRAVMWASKAIFLDEPTAALGVVQTRAVLDLIRKVRDTGCAVVLISHNMPEVLEVSDRIEVLRLGRRVASLRAANTSMEEIVGAMTGALQGAA
jgi:simple sugar transport system ATP-binding protein